MRRSIVATLAVPALALTGCGAGVTTVGSTTPLPSTSPATEAPSFAPDSAGREAATHCAREITGNAHASCPFAEGVQTAFARSYSPSHPPATVNAYSPATHREYTLRCSLREESTFVQCVTGDAVVVFPLEAKPTDIDEIGSASHAGDASFCEAHTCIGNFTEEEGTVVECSDGTYSHAGGIAGACSDHGGEAESEEEAHEEGKE